MSPRIDLALRLSKEPRADLTPYSPDSAGHLFIPFFSFQFSFFHWIKLGLFLLFPFAFISFSLVTHIRFSLPENDSRQFVRLAFEYTAYLSFLPPSHFISRSMVS